MSEGIAKCKSCDRMVPTDTHPIELHGPFCTERDLANIRNRLEAAEARVALLERLLLEARGSLDGLAHFGHIVGGSLDNGTFRDLTEPLMLAARPIVEKVDAALAEGRK